MAKSKVVDETLPSEPRWLGFVSSPNSTLALILMLHSSCLINSIEDPGDGKQGRPMSTSVVLRCSNQCSDTPDRPSMVSRSLIPAHLAPPLHDYNSAPTYQSYIILSCLQLGRSTSSSPGSSLFCHNNFYLQDATRAGAGATKG